jgi:hypothetical protein
VGAPVVDAFLLRLAARRGGTPVAEGVLAGGHAERVRKTTMTLDHKALFALLMLAAPAGCADAGLADDPEEVAEAAAESEDIAEASSALSPYLPPEPCAGIPMFTHVATAGNTPAGSHWTEVHHPEIDGDVKTTLLVTPNWTPQGGAEVRNYHPVGVWYFADTGTWIIYNVDGAPMPHGTAFNVRVSDGYIIRSPYPSATVLAFEAVQAGGGAHLFVTANGNAPGGPPMSSWSPVAVRPSMQPYSAWDLIDDDGVPFNPGTAFNIADVECGAVHKVTLDNLVPPADTALPDTLATNKSAVILATTRLPGGANPVPQDPQHLAVRYDQGLGRWMVHSWGNYLESMALDAKMNVLVQLPVLPPP